MSCAVLIHFSTGLYKVFMLFCNSKNVFCLLKNIAFTSFLLRKTLEMPLHVHGLEDWKRMDLG
jgi:hypothetical protein